MQQAIRDTFDDIRKLAAHHLQIGPKGRAAASIENVFIGAHGLGPVFLEWERFQTYFKVQSVQELIAAATSATVRDDVEAVVRRAAVSMNGLLMLPKYDDSFGPFWRIVKENQSETLEALIKGISEWVRGRKNEPCDLLPRRGVNEQGPQLEPHEDFHIFKFEGRTYKLNDTEAAAAKQLFEARHPVRKKTILRETSYERVSRLFGSRDGKRFYTDLVTHDGKGFYSLKMN